MRAIDLRSDTVTVPTPEMRRAMSEAEVGDDVYGEDPTVRRLEELASELTGKEAGLFLPSGTMGNQVAAMTHTMRGDEVLVDAESHIYYYEVGGLAALSGVQPRPLRCEAGAMRPKDVESAMRAENIHFPRTSLLCLENTHNMAGGTVMTPEETRALCETARRYGLAVHLDGARIFNAAVALGVDVKELAAPADSVMFCLSKGLCAPVGSMLVGRADWIAGARKNRKLLGGGMRQAGVLAAAGIVALTAMVHRLAEDHANARLLAEELAGMKGIGIDAAGVKTNIVRFEVEPSLGSAPRLAKALMQRGVLVNAMGSACLRAVTHKDVSRDDVLRAAAIIGETVSGLRKG